MGGEKLTAFAWNGFVVFFELHEPNVDFTSTSFKYRTDDFIIVMTIEYEHIVDVQRNMEIYIHILHE